VQWISWHSLLTRHKDRKYRSHFSCVSCLSSRAVHLDMADIQRINVRVPNHALEERGLIAFMGPGNRNCMGRVIRVCGCNHAEDGIVVRFCILEALQNDRTNGICSAVAASFIVERIAITCRAMSIPAPKGSTHTYLWWIRNVLGRGRQSYPGSSGRWSRRQRQHRNLLAIDNCMLSVSKRSWKSTLCRCSNSGLKSQRSSCA
jgi:hypothetical protein